MSYKTKTRSITRTFLNNQCKRCSSVAMAYRYNESSCLACGWHPGESTENYTERRQVRTAQVQPEDGRAYQWDKQMDRYIKEIPREAERLRRNNDYPRSKTLCQSA